MKHCCIYLFCLSGKYALFLLMIKIKKTKWMRPVDMAIYLGTSKQNVNNMQLRKKLEVKKDRYGITLVRGK